MALPDTFGPQVYSVEQAAAALGISRRTAFRHVASGALRTIKLGRRRLVPAAELARLMGSSTPAPSAMPNREDVEGRGCDLVAPPETPRALADQPPVRVSLSKLLARVRAPSGGG